MDMRLNVIGGILSFILATGAVILAMQDKDMWFMFLIAAIFIFLISNFRKE